MIASRDPVKRKELAAALRDYCRRDTYAMIRIHRVLENHV